jgi:hypothetical protein
MLLAIGLAAFATAWAFWLTYMVKYPQRWSAQVERHRQLLLSWRIDLPAMHVLEKGFAIKILVAATIVITLLCVVVLLRHPTALQDFWRGFMFRQS